MSTPTFFRDFKILIHPLPRTVSFIEKELTGEKPTQFENIASKNLPLKQIF